MDKLLKTAFFLIIMASSSLAGAYDLKSCDPDAEADIKAAADFLDANMSTLVDRYTFLSEKQRQEVVRKWTRLNIRCADTEATCSGNTTGRAHGSVGNTIKLCYYTRVRLGGTLCDLANDIMHEQGHAHGFRMVPGHNDPTDYHFENDPMYRMGSMAENFCEYRAGLDPADSFDDFALTGEGQRPIGDACSEDLQCDSKRCSQNICVCDDNSDCPAGQECFKPVAGRNFCSSTSRGIGAACTREDQCRSNQCEGGVCVCRHDSDCPSGQVCKTPITGSNKCEAADKAIGAKALGSSCDKDSVCLSNKCENDKCVCNSDSDCPAGQECYRPVTSSNVCRTVGLALGAGCQRDNQCRSNKCEKDKCVCRTDDDCPDGQRCKTPITGSNRCES